MFATLLALSAPLQVDLSLTPSQLCVAPNGLVELELVLSGNTPSTIAAVDLILTWDPGALVLFDATAQDGGWFVSGFLPDPDGINASTNDGDALFTLLASPSLPPSVPPSLTAARFRFVAFGDSAIDVPATLGANGATQVVGIVPGVPLTGALPTTVQVGVAPPTQAFEVVRNGALPNPAAFLPGQSAGPVLGSTWDPVVDHSSFLPGALLDLFAATLAPVDLSLPPFGSLLCLPPVVGGPFSSAAGVPFQIPVPEVCALVGVTLCTQAFSVDGGGAVLLTNALDITFGTF